VALLVGGHAGVQEGLGGGDVGGALGQREARVLELADGLAEGLALLHVFQRGIERALGAVHRLHADDEALARQLAHHLHEALAFHAAEQGVGRHAHVVEEQLGGVARVLADFFEVLAAREAGRGASTRNRLTPLAPAAGSVLAASTSRSQFWPLLMKILLPLMT
jgi:hypothetical protein